MGLNRAGGGSRRRWVLPGLAAILVAAGLMLLAAGCSTPKYGVSPIPASVSSTAPAMGSSSAAAKAPAASGFAARSIPVSITIPAIGVSAPVTELGLNADGSLATPPLSNLNLTGWYKYGPSPGQQGPAVIVGHIDSTAGPSVFFRLRYLTDGDKISVTLADGKTAVFAVTGMQQTAKTAFPTSEVYGHLSYAGLRLITCGGVFDYSTGHYLSNVIVYARAVS
jgi:sortase (surface protein transpeptidase)